jgi:hypothetical protein
MRSNFVRASLNLILAFSMVTNNHMCLVNGVDFEFLLARSLCKLLWSRGYRHALRFMSPIGLISSENSTLQGIHTYLAHD